MTHICFIGGGNMARCLIGGLIANGHPKTQLVAAEPNAAQRDALAADFGIQTYADNTQAAANADVILLAVKPQVMGTVCRALSSIEHARTAPMYISIAAGIAVKHLAQWLGADAALVRAMPNTPALIGAGACGLYANAAVSDLQRERATAILSAAGDVRWIDDEALMDAVTAISGSGPAYFFLLMEAMIDAGIAQGLPAATARDLVLQTALGAARMAREGDEMPAVLRQRVTSPNGTTQAAIETFEAMGLRNVVNAAVARATERGRELAAEFGD